QSQAFSGRDELTGMLDRQRPGLEVTLEVNRQGGKKTDTLKLTLGVMSETVPDDSLPEPATAKKALEPRKVAPRPGPQRPVMPKTGDKNEKKKGLPAQPKKA